MSAEEFSEFYVCPCCLNRRPESESETTDDESDYSDTPSWYSRVHRSSEWKHIDGLSRDHIYLWLTINDLINECNETMLAPHLTSESFLKLFGCGKAEMLIDQCTFGSCKSLIQSFVRNNYLDESKLRLLYNVISKLRIPIIQTTNRRNFQSLPDECVSNVCSYLSRIDIFWFKLTSRHVAILCLEAMNKVPVGIFDVSKFSMNVERHNPNKSLHTLYGKWSKDYNIPVRNQLLFTDTDVCFLGCGDNLKLFNAEKEKCGALCGIQRDRVIKGKELKQTMPKRISFLIADNRNVIILNQDGARMYDVERDSFDKLWNYRLMILKCRDCESSQLLLCDPKILYRDIIDYVENKFICLNKHEKEWYGKLKCSLCEMECDDDHQKLDLFLISNDLYATSCYRVSRDCLQKPNYEYGRFCCMYSLNPRHPDYFKTSEGKRVREQLDATSYDKVDIDCAIRLFQGGHVAVDYDRTDSKSVFEEIKDVIIVLKDPKGKFMYQEPWRGYRFFLGNDECKYMYEMY